MCCKKLYLILILLLLSAELCLASPFRPGSGSSVVKVFSFTNEMKEVALLRKQLEIAPDNYALLDEILTRYMDVGRKESEPRYFGYAEAMIKPYLSISNLPDIIYIHWADILQHRHDFNGALKVLDKLAENNSPYQQVYLMRAVGYLTQGKYHQALENCKSLVLRASHLVTASCVAQVKSLTGNLDAAFDLLMNAINKNKNSEAQVLTWSLTLLADMAVRRGEISLAEELYKEGLELGEEKHFLLASYADLLLMQHKYKEVISLLEEFTSVDSLLLRLSLASFKDNRIVSQQYIAKLSANYQLNELRGEILHLRDQAIFYLELKNDLDKALYYAQRNWEIQKEPEDAKLLLKVSLRTGNKKHAESVILWLSKNPLEDIEVSKIKKQIARM